MKRTCERELAFKTIYSKLFNFEVDDNDEITNIDNSNLAKNIIDI